MVKPMSNKKRWAKELKRAKANRIAYLRKGGKRDRRAAIQIAECRKGSRCNLDECPVCERRRKRAGRGTSATKTVIGGLTHNSLVEWVEVTGKPRALDEAKVKFIAASMREIGLQNAITLRHVGKNAVLVSGFYRLAAAKLLGWKTIRSFYMVGNKIDARLWQISENFHRVDLTVLERAELTEEWRMLIRERVKVGQVAPPGGHQPEDAGINKTAKELGLTKEEVRRSKAIAKISPKAKEAAIAGKVHNNQLALLQIAKEPTPSAQLKVIEEIVERRRAVRDRHASVTEQRVAGEIAGLKAGLAKNKGAVESLEAKIAKQRERLHELKDMPATDYGDMAALATSPLMAPSDNDGLSELDSPLDIDVDKAFARLCSAWHSAPEASRKRFVVEVLDHERSAKLRGQDNF